MAALWREGIEGTSDHCEDEAYARHRYYERFTASSFTNDDITSNDVAAGEDPVVAPRLWTLSATITGRS